MKLIYFKLFIAKFIVKFTNRFIVQFLDTLLHGYKSYKVLAAKINIIY